MTTWLVIVAVGAGSYAFRVLPLVLDGRWTSAPRIERTMAYAGTSALAALTATGLRHGSPTAVDAVGVGAAAVVALTVAVRGGSMLRVLFAGAVAYAIVRSGATFLL